MNKDKLKEVSKLIDNNKINEAQIELSKLGQEYYKNSEYLYLRSKIFFLNKLYYLAIDTLLVALEFEQRVKDYINNTLNNHSNCLIYYFYGLHIIFKFC